MQETKKKKNKNNNSRNRSAFLLFFLSTFLPFLEWKVKVLNWLTVHTKQRCDHSIWNWHFDGFEWINCVAFIEMVPKLILEWIFWVNLFEPCSKFAVEMFRGFNVLIWNHHIDIALTFHSIIWQTSKVWLCHSLYDMSAGSFYIDINVRSHWKWHLVEIDDEGN